MKYEIVEKPTFALLRVYLESGENVFSETGAMVSISGDIEMKTKLAGGLFKSLMRSVAGGEALFINEFVAKSSGYIEFAPALPGDIEYIELSNDSMVIQDGAYLAHHGDLSYEVKFSGLRKLAAGLGFAHLEFSGNGGLWINSYGAIMKKELKEGEKFTLDNTHFVATNSKNFEIKRVGKGLKSLVFGGEGIVLSFEGPCEVYYQTRSFGSLVDLIARYVKG